MRLRIARVIYAHKVKRAARERTQFSSTWKSKVPPLVMEAVKITKGLSDQVFIVGGAVRDLITGKTPKDFDLVSNVDFDQLKEAFEERGWWADETGKTFGILRVKKQGEEIEIAKFRKDLHPEPGKTVVEEGTIYDDAHRRDLTINALYLDPVSGKILDPTGQGLNDIRSGVVRFVGNADERLKEDFSRLFRYFKFLRKMNFKPDPGSLKAVKDNIINLAKTAPAKIMSELEKAIELEEHLEENALHFNTNEYNKYPKKLSIKELKGLKREERVEYLKSNPSVMLKYYRDLKNLKEQGFIPLKDDLAIIRDNLNLLGHVEEKTEKQLEKHLTTMFNLLAEIYEVEDLVKDFA